MGGLLTEHTEREGLRVVIRTAGFSAGGESPTDQTVRFLASRGIDVKGYQSHWMSDLSVSGANLIVTAEHEHVVAIAGRWAPAFKYTFTLPELVARAGEVGRRGEQPLEQWLTAVNAGRPSAIDYLDSEVGQIYDPSGRSPTVWSGCFTEIDELTSRLASLLT